MDLWNKNRTGELCTFLQPVPGITHRKLGMYSAGFGRTLGIMPPFKVFDNQSAVDALVKDARANITKFATQFSNGNKDLAKGIEAQYQLALDLFEQDKNGPIEMTFSKDDPRDQLFYRS